MIELSDVEAVTTEQITNKVFEMVDAIASHKQKRALELYYDLLALKEPAMRIMYLISRQFNILMNVKAMTKAGFGNKDIASGPDVRSGRYANIRRSAGHIRWMI